MHRIACHNAFLHHVADALFDRTHVVVGDCAAKDIVRESEIFAFDRENLQRNFTKLSRTARLFLMAICGAAFAGDVLFIGHFGFEGDQVELEFLLHAFQGNIDMLIAHAKQQSLMCGSFHFPGEGHIFFRHAGQSLAHLGCVALGLGIDRNTVEGVGVGWDRQDDILFLGCQGIAGGGDAQLCHRANIAAVDHADGQHVLAEGHLNAGKTFFLALVCVPDARIRADHAGIDFEVSLAPNKGVSSGFPNIGCKWSCILVGQFNFTLGSVGFDRRQLGRARSELYEHVQQGLDTDAATAGSYQHGDDVAVLHGFAQTLQNLSGGQITIFEVFSSRLSSPSAAASTSACGLLRLQPGGRQG